MDPGMADETDEEEFVAAPVVAAKAPGMPVIPLIVAVVLAVAVAVAGAGGALYWLVKSGKMPIPSGPSKVQVITVQGLPKTHEVALEPLLVNLADDGGHAYLRVTITLSVEDPPPPEKGDKPKEEKAPEKGGKVPIEHDAEIRDAALSVIGSESSQALLGPTGKEDLKKSLRAALTARVPTLKVVDVFFTEFLVQR